MANSGIFHTVLRENLSEYFRLFLNSSSWGYFFLSFLASYNLETLEIIFLSRGAALWPTHKPPNTQIQIHDLKTTYVAGRASPPAIHRPPTHLPPLSVST